MDLLWEVIVNGGNGGGAVGTQGRGRGVEKGSFSFSRLLCSEE